MWQLRRMRLESVGVTDARFAPLELELTDEFGAPTDTVLWLDNGGGKSTMLGLVMSVLRPAFREFLGQLKTDNHLYEYVRDDDVAHIILEWARPAAQRRLNGDGQQRLVTGQVLQWRDMRADHEQASEKLLRTFYAFRAADGLTLDTLPVTADNKRLPLNDFVDELREMIRACRPVDYFITRHQAEWKQWLAETAQLDPEVFRYQVEMNADEGAIDEAFEKLDSEDAFVRWTLDVVTDDSFPRQLAGQLTTIRTRLEEQPLLELEASFCGDAAALLDNAADAHDLATETRELLAEATDQATALISELAAAAELATSDESTRREEARSLQEAVDTATKLEGRLRRQANTAAKIAAELQLDEATECRDETQAAFENAKTVLDAWVATELVVDQDHAQAAVRRLAAELAKARADVKPLLDEVAATRGRLAAKLLSLMERAQASHRQAIDGADRAQQQAKDHERKAAEFDDQAMTANSERAKLADRIDTFEQQLATIRSDGLVEPADTAQQALDRQRSVRDELDRRIGRIKGDLTEARNRRTELLATQRQLEAQRSPLQIALQKATGDQQQFFDDRHEVASMPALREAAGSGDEPVETQLLLVQTATLTSRFDDLIAAAEDEDVDQRLHVTQDEAFIEAVDLHGRLPASSDVEAALSEIRRRGIPAVSGWQHLAEAVRAERRAELVRALPHFAAGIILQDNARFDEAVATLESFAPVTGPVTVTIRDAFDESVDLQVPVHVVDAPEGLYDRQAAQREAETRRTDLQRRRETLEELAARLRSLRDGAASLRRFTARYDELTEGRLTRAVSDAAQALEKHEGRIEAADEDFRHADSEAQALEGKLEQLQEHRAGVMNALARLGPVATAEGDVPAWREQLAAASRTFESARRSAEQHRRAVTAAQEEARRLSAEAETHRAEAGRHAGRLRDFDLTRLDAAEQDVPDETVEVLVDAHQRAKDAYERDRPDLTVEDELAGARQRLGDLEAKLSRFSDLARARARQLLTDVGVDNATERAHRHQLAAGAVKAAERELWQADEDVKAAERDLSDVNAAAGDRGPLDVDTPTTAKAARELREELLGEVEGQRRARGEAERSRDAVAHKADQAKTRAQQFSSHVRRLSEDSLVAPLRLLDRTLQVRDDADPFTGDLEQAGRRVDTVAAQLQRLATDLTEARELRTQAERDVVDLAKDRRYDDLAKDEARDNLIGRLSDGTSLASEARRLAGELRDRKLTIDRDLEEITRHRQHFVELLSAAADHALGLLNAISRTRLPDEGLGEWSGKPFLRITHDAVPGDPAVVTTRLEELLRRLVAGGVSERSEVELGRRLVFEAAKASVGGGFKVTILKPRSKQLRYEPVPVTHLTKFSGGQRVTAAIVIFATLVSMRAKAAGHAGRPRSVLILDNPVGKASADTFVNLQRQVAAKTGVQLIYATGVNDLGALGQFTRVVRLDGKENLRTSDVHLVASEQFTALSAVGLTQRASMADDSELDAKPMTRVTKVTVADD